MNDFIRVDIKETDGSVATVFVRRSKILSFQLAMGKISLEVEGLGHALTFWVDSKESTQAMFDQLVRSMTA